MSTPQIERRDDAVLPLDVDQLAAVIERAAGRSPRHLTVRPFAYETSAPLFEVCVRTSDAEWQLVLKDLGWWSLNDGARIAKPRELHDPSREPWVYQHLLAGDRGPARRWAHSIGPERSWLLLERVAGRELYQWGELEPWIAAVGWLARFHSAWASPTRRRAVTDDGPLIVHDHTLLHAYGEPDHDWVRAARHLLAQPRTVVHGECYASDVLVDDDGRVTVLDWETTAIGSGWVDLAGIVAGWDDPTVEVLLEHYLRNLDPSLWPAQPEATLDAARLQLSRQLCTTSHLWQPPLEHRVDWAAEADRLVAKGHRW